jgi:hypothetical protein
MKKFDDSRKAAAQCLAALPNYAPALNNLALLQITLGQLTDADGNLRASMEADAGLTCAQSNAASLQVRCCALFGALFGALVWSGARACDACAGNAAVCKCSPHAPSLLVAPMQSLRQHELRRIQNLGSGAVNFR